MADRNLTKEDLRTYLRYEFDQGRTATKAMQNINTTYGEGTIGRTAAFKWYARFNNGEFAVEDSSRSGRPVNFDEDQLKELLEEDNRQTTRELAEQMGCDQITTSCYLATRQ